jgi:hypothetical protein
MATGLNVIPVGATQNVYAQQYAQALRNLQTGRAAFETAVATIVRAQEATGGGATDVAALFGLTSAQATVLYTESTAFRASLLTIEAAWDQINAIMGIIV